MANYIEITRPDLQAYTSSTLAVDTTAGATTLTVDSTNGWNANDYAILGILGTNTVELVQAASVTNNTTLTLVSPIKFVHFSTSSTTGSPAIAQLIKTPFNSIQLYSGTSPDLSTHTLLQTQPISWITDQTLFIDTAGTATTYYSFSYYNSTTQSGTPLQPVVGFGIPLDVTPDFIRQNYLYGLDLTDNDGNPLPDSLYWIGIISAYHWLEQMLQIDIIPRTRVDNLDFDPSQYRAFVTLKTWYYPVLQIQSVQANYYGQTVDFPTDWVRLKPRAGVFNLVPNGGAFSQFLIPASSGGILPLLNLAGTGFIPGFWIITYTTGFESGTLPYNMRDIIAKKACFMPLNILGDLVGGVAIASKSIGIDGISESINTTSSPENAGYSARLRMYQSEFKADLADLKKYWTRIGMIVA